MKSGHSIFLILAREMLHAYAGTAARDLSRWKTGIRRNKRLRALRQTVEEKLLSLFAIALGLCGGSCAELVCHTAAVLEVWLVIHLVGVHIGLPVSFAAETRTKIVHSVGGFNPGDIGTYKGDPMLIAKFLDLEGPWPRPSFAGYAGWTGRG